MKKASYFAAIIASLAGFLFFSATAFAATPAITLTNNGDGDTVLVNVTGDANSAVLMFYTKTNYGTQVTTLGTTNGSGLLAANISTSGYGIASGSSVYVQTGGLNGTQSPIATWPNVTTNGGFSLNPTGLVLTIGQSSTITASNNGASAIYLSNNSNPPVANANINSNQITITAISNGSTVITVCVPAVSQGSAAACASAYVTVQNSGAQTLNFSVSNVTVAPGQSIPITISGGNGIYSVLNNSNSSLIQTSISNSTLTLSSTGTTGSASITICSSDMLACGIVNASAGTNSTQPLTFNPTNPTLSLGQNLSVVVSGGAASATYYISSNSNPSIATSTISGYNITLTGSNYGTTNVTVCASSGGCGVLPVTVSYISYGGPVVLSQNVISLLVGQVFTVTATGGATPYTLTQSQSNIFQSSLNGNLITLSGIAAGSANLTVCPAGGSCATLAVTVNASGAGTPVTFSQNNLNLNVGNISAITISGSGGYYVSTSANPNVASVQISGSTALITALVAGNNNVSICQSGGQCAILFITVSAGSSAVLVPTFSQINPVMAAGQVVKINISGGSGSNYYILANTNPNVLQLSLNSSQLTLTGLTSGSSSVAVCAATNSCSVLTVTVTGTPATTISFNTNSLNAATVGQIYNSQISVGGGNGNYTFAITSGSLPDGMALSTNGLLSGTPTTAATSNFTIRASDTSSNSASANFSLTVNAPTPNNPNTTGSANYQNGQLIKENGTIYIVYKNTKVGFTNAQAFLGLGFKFNNVTQVSNSGLSISPKTVITAVGSHPRGTWVSNGQSVFLVTPDGLIPVPNWSTFLNNGGQASYIVKANTYDLAMKRLTAMNNNDSRLR